MVNEKQPLSRGKLRGKIIEKFGTYKAFAEALGVDSAAVSQKLNNIVGITQDDVIKWSKVLELELEEIGPIFFAPEVQNI